MSLTDILKEYEAGKVSVPAVAKEIVGFFQAELARIENSQKKEEQIQKTTEALQNLVGLLNPYINVVGLSEEALVTSLENPDYFDRDEWQLVQATKEELNEIARRLLVYLATEPSPEEPKRAVTEK